VGVVFIVLVGEQWGRHPLAWSLSVVGVAAVLTFVFIRFPDFRASTWHTTKAAAGALAFFIASLFESVGAQRKERTGIPSHIKKAVARRARRRCENPQCWERDVHDYHHINENPSDHRPRNLIYLCPTCHRKAGNGVFTRTELRAWVTSDSAARRGGRIH